MGQISECSGKFYQPCSKKNEGVVEVSYLLFMVTGRYSTEDGLNNSLLQGQFFRLQYFTFQVHIKIAAPWLIFSPPLP